MPHTSHRKKQGQKKRLQVNSEDGWTTITSSSSGASDAQKSHESGFSRTFLIPHNSNAHPADIPEGYTLDKLNEDYSRYEKVWTNSQCSKELATILQERIAGTQHGQQPVFTDKLDNCVCIGLGSMVDAVSRRAALLQFAALKQILSILDEERTRPALRSSCIAQDPVFNELDMDFLATTHQVTILRDPEKAASHISNSTFLYAPHCEWSFLLPALQGGAMSPSLVVCNDIEPLISGPLSTSLHGLVSDKAREFVHLPAREAVAFPRFEPHDSVFNDLSIYWRASEPSRDDKC
ncbi:MAG: hypothetical protein M4579_004183 [Chaenotheca gracillima]|nr:MAG: hypothetical protein M4579_004183 [Chaenotheca gracillima]